MERSKTPRRAWFYPWLQQTFAHPLSFLTDSSLVWCSTSVLVTTGSIRQYLQPSQIAQVVQGDTLICKVTWQFAVSPSTTSRAWNRCDWGWGVNIRIGRSAAGTPFSSQMRSDSHWPHPTDEKEPGDACNIIQHDWFGSGSVMVWGSMSVWVAQTSISGSTVSWLLLGTGMKSSERLSDLRLVQCVRVPNGAGQCLDSCGQSVWAVAGWQTHWCHWLVLLFLWPKSQLCTLCIGALPSTATDGGSACDLNFLLKFWVDDFGFHWLLKSLCSQQIIQCTSVFQLESFIHPYLMCDWNVPLTFF